jgi:hypothetical protein
MEILASLIGRLRDVAVCRFNLGSCSSASPLGLFIGAMPGLGSVNGVAIVLPLTFIVPPDLGDHPARRDLLRRDVRRRDQLDPAGHPRRVDGGRHHLRRPADGAAGQGGARADRGRRRLVRRAARSR